MNTIRKVLNFHDCVEVKGQPTCNGCSIYRLPTEPVVWPCITVLCVVNTLFTVPERTQMRHLLLHS